MSDMSGADPFEHMYQCKECEGDGGVNVPDPEDETMVVSGECPTCGGSGIVSSDKGDEKYGYIRVEY